MMAKQSLHGVLHHLRKLVAVQTYRSLSDRELLERFVGAHDDAAFTALIERHGPMVLGVCRRALPNFHDAEDACQATFLVLARKATGTAGDLSSALKWSKDDPFQLDPGSQTLTVSAGTASFTYLPAYA